MFDSVNDSPAFIALAFSKILAIDFCLYVESALTVSTSLPLLNIASVAVVESDSPSSDNLRSATAREIMLVMFSQ